MKKTFTVTGMSCQHCSGRVKTALEALPNVKAAEVNLKKQRATVKSDVEIADSILKAAVTDAGYEAIFD